MKKEVPIEISRRIINSGQVVLVSSAYKEKKNIITLAWNMPLSHKPPLVAVSLGKTHFSTELIRKSEEFIINVPTLDLLESVVYCGTHSGRGVDKFKETGLTAEKSTKLVKTPLIKDCIGHLECRLRDVKDVMDHFLFIGEVVHASCEEDLFSDGIWDVGKVKLVYHLGGRCFTVSERKIVV